MIRNLVHLSPICITFVATMLLLKSFWEMNIKDIASGSQTTWYIMANLYRQKVEAAIVSILLVIAFLLQIYNESQPFYATDREGISMSVLLLALGLTLLLFILCVVVSKKVTQKVFEQALSEIFGKVPKPNQ